MGTQLELLLVVLCLMNKLALAQLSDPMNETYMTKPGCSYRCNGGNNVTIPYPFGIGSDCALNEAFVIICDSAFIPPRPFISTFGQPVISILLEDMKVVVEVTTSIYSNVSRNSVINTVHIKLDWPILESCHTSPSCSSQLQCYSYRRNATFSCSCNDGYEGNPYLPNGCQDIDECAQPQNIEYCTRGCVNTQGSFICKKPSKKAKIAMIGIGSGVGTILLLLGLWQVYKMIKRRNKMKLERKFFKRNGGLLLQKQLSSGEEGNVEKIKLFTSKDLEKATDRYNKNRIIGQGGQGTVYKGTLTDGRIVAIKVSAIVDERNLEQFINEVVILSQINHRNVVKLHGCCLETEVPLLVYEFIPNGTLFQYIHDKNEDFPLSWDVRLRIAIEVASALSYLHSAASVPIYHRDIKSTNILLDEKYKAKVADFGTSRSITIDQTHLTTRVSGTFGYLDPEYFQSSQFTEKSDVYSFGVVLVELLTGQKPISSTRSEESRSLTTYFMDALKEKCIFDILDAQVQKEAGKEEITRVINLAKRCLNLSGRKRPTMREVTMELEGITMPNGTSTFDERDEEGEYEVIELVVPFETSILTSRGCSDAHPIIFE